MMYVRFTTKYITYIFGLEGGEGGRFFCGGGGCCGNPRGRIIYMQSKQKIFIKYQYLASLSLLLSHSVWWGLVERNTGE
jgi:hypothetical protein